MKISEIVLQNVIAHRNYRRAKIVLWLMDQEIDDMVDFIGANLSAKQPTPRDWRERKVPIIGRPNPTRPVLETHLCFPGWKEAEYQTGWRKSWKSCRMASEIRDAEAGTTCSL